MFYTIFKLFINIFYKLPLMFKTSIFINLYSDLKKEAILNLLESKKIEDKLQGMQVVLSTNHNISFHTIIKEILPFDNNELKRLLYYYFEITKLSDTELLLLNNQIRKDLEGPNEFIRGIVLKFLCNMSLCKQFENLILSNLSHSVSYVRRNAYFCLSKIDNIKLIYNCLIKETEPLCLVQLFYILHIKDKNLSFKYALEIKNTKCKELSLLFIDTFNDFDFIYNFVDDTNPEVQISSCLKLIKLYSNKNDMDKKFDLIYLWESIIKNIKNNQEFIDEIIELDIPSKYYKNIFSFIDIYDLKKSKKIIKKVFEICKPDDYFDISTLILSKIKNNHTCLNIIFLEEICNLIKATGFCHDDIIKYSFKNFINNNPSLSNAILQVFKEYIIYNINIKEVDFIFEFLINSLVKISYGKIFRDVFSFLTKYSNEKQFFKIVDNIDQSFINFCNNNPNSLIIFRQNNLYLIPFVCILINERKKTCLEKIQALFLGFLKHKDLLDLSSKSTIESCLSSDIKVEHDIAKNDIHNNVKSIDVGCPLDLFSFDKEKSLQKFLNSQFEKRNIMQLTGLNDPIYVEAELIFKRYEIILDLLFINQTENFLQNMTFEFYTSKNIVKKNDLKLQCMKGRSIVSDKIRFDVLDSYSGFISGSVTFKFPLDKNLSLCTLNFNDIKTDVLDNLEKKDMTEDEFKNNWKKMEWENVYINKINYTDIEKIFNVFCKYLKGTLINIIKNDFLLVGNITCTTKHNDNLLLNICMSRNNKQTNIECRMRGNKEDLVKSMSSIMGRVCKEIREIQ